MPETEPQPRKTRAPKRPDSWYRELHTETKRYVEAKQRKKERDAAKR